MLRPVFVVSNPFNQLLKRLSLFLGRGGQLCRLPAMPTP
jgi:hypothetical protein